MDSLKRTPLNKKHLSLDAKMVGFGGWEMPVQYEEGIISEHLHTRKSASIFDTCHMGEFRIKGENVALELHKNFPRSVKTQKPGSVRYNFLLTDEGTVIDDLLIYCIDDDEFMLVVNAGTIEADEKRLRELMPDTVSISNESDNMGKLDLQGPESANVLEKLDFQKADLPKGFKFINTNINGKPVLLSRTGYTGELGFEIYTNAEDVGELWDLFLSIQEVKPAGLGARDTLRLEVCLPLNGSELDKNTTPVEAGFKPLLKFKKRKGFIAEHILKDPDHVKKRLKGIVLEGRRAARHGNKVLTSDDAQTEIGYITSGMFSPILKKAIALAYIDSQYSYDPGDEVSIKVGRKNLKGTIVSLPFYKEGTARVSLDNE